MESGADKGGDAVAEAATWTADDELRADALRADARRVLTALRRAAERPPCLVLLGESNAGKTTLANRLIGDGLLPTSVIANTRYPLLVRYADEMSVMAVTAACQIVPLDAESTPDPQSITMLEIGLPNQRLRDYEVLDTPADKEQAVSELPRLAPLRIPVWCTNATQAWKESERRTWLAMGRAGRRNGVLAVTRLDRILDEAQRRRLKLRLEDETAGLFAAIVPSTGMTGTDSALELAERCRRLHARRKRTVARLTARISALAGVGPGVEDAALPEESERRVATSS